MLERKTKYNFQRNAFSEKNIITSFFLLFLVLFINLPLYASTKESELNFGVKNDSEETNNIDSIDENIVDPDKPMILKGHVSKIPGGTKSKIILEAPVDELTSMVYDEIKTRISENVTINNNIVIPAGSSVTGVISEITPAKRLHKAGTVRIEFKNLSLPDGREVPIVASVLTRSGLLKGKLTKKNAILSGTTLLVPAVAGVGAGLAAQGSAVGAGIGAALGVLAGASLYAYQKGNKVDIMAGDELSIELTEEAIIPDINANTDSGELLSDEKALKKQDFCILKRK